LKTRSFIADSILLIGSFAFIFAFLELVIFRYFFLPGSLPELAETPASQVLHYAPNQEGIYRVKTEIKSSYRVNSSGWNSGKKMYLPAEEVEKPVIAIIGDSYVEAFQVPYDSSIAEQLEQQFQQSAVVYRFGISGAPISQYLFMLNELVSKLSPQLVIFVLIHNDFHESVIGSQTGLYTESFSKWPINLDGTLGQLSKPKAYNKGLLSIIKRSNIYNFFVNRMRVNLSALKPKLIGLLSPSNKSELEFVANIQKSTLLADLPTRVAQRFFEELAAVSTDSDMRFLAVIDGPRGELLPECNDPHNSSILSFNKNVAAIAKNTGIPFVDLSGVFLEAQCKRGVSLRFQTDGHWTIAAHQLAAEAIREKISAIFDLPETWKTHL
jgi:lysophospholipase L1-like esterase